MAKAHAGQSFYPEMGGRSDGTALFETSIGRSGYYVKWIAARHQEALAAFKSLRVRPRHMELNTSCLSGREYWSCCVTWDAGQKLRPIAAHEMLLD